MPPPPILEAAGVAAAYGAAPVLFGVDLVVAAGETVALLGRNGMGKTSFVRALLGQIDSLGGNIRLAGRDIGALATAERAAAGIGLVPEGRQIFPSLTARENLLVAARSGPRGKAGWDLDRVLALLPALKGRLAAPGALLSGGEQQMLAIGRALMTNPLLLVLDEATEGLAPQVRDTIWACLRQLKADGLAVLVIDKHVAILSRLADRLYVMDKGRIAWTGTGADLAAAPDITARHLGL